MARGGTDRLSTTPHGFERDCIHINGGWLFLVAENVGFTEQLLLLSFCVRFLVSYVGQVQTSGTPLQREADFTTRINILYLPRRAISSVCAIPEPGFKVQRLDVSFTNITSIAPSC